MKKDTVMGVWQHLMNAEAFANAGSLALQQKDTPSETELHTMERVGALAAKISRVRRDWEYWFVTPEDIQGDHKLRQGLLPFEKKWYTE